VLTCFTDRIEWVDIAIAKIYERIREDLETIIIIEQTWVEIGKTTENTMWVKGPRKDITKKGFLEHGLGAERQFRVFLELLKDLHYGIVQADAYIKKGTGVKKGEEEIKRGRD